MSALRLDRLATLCVFHPLHRATSGAGEFRLPILMYHSISEEPEAGVSSYYRTATSPRVFAQHMALLRALGCEAVSLKVGLEMLRRERTGQGKPVVLTFDDGFRDFHTMAFPILREHGFSATVFLPTAFIGQEPLQFKARECMTWSEVRELHRAGIEFGSHTVHHPTLHELDFAQVRSELEQSKAAIEDELGEPIGSFAYPYAFPSADRSFVTAFRDMVAEAGYACCATTELGRVRIGGDPYRLKRLPANSLDDAAFLQAKLEGGYDWLAFPQAVVKNSKRWFLGSGQKPRSFALTARV
jgi:peptidoglycan/xylan/chitin deacetylase (PgdA/CDA1 family)